MIHIFQRHCNFSSNSIGKSRPSWFSREKCFKNLLKTLTDDVKLTVVFDGEPDNHFIDTYEGFELVSFKGGNDGLSFLNLLNYVESLDLPEDDIIYLLEDDYLHQNNWEVVLQEGLARPGVEYVTLYDHRDKYFLPMYNDLQSQIIVTASSHWRTIPSTTNTYACKVSTLRKHMNIHKEYCDLDKGFTRDHDKFVRLWQEGSNLISPVPGYSTHVEVEYMSPVIDWEQYGNI